MESLFTTFTHAMSGTPIIALLAAFIWGVLSMLLSPCHLASIPLIVGFIDDQGEQSVRRAALIASLFALGILVTIALIGIFTAAAGRMMGDLGALGNYLVAALFFGVGLQFLGVFKNPFTPKADRKKMPHRGLWGAFLLGLLFGVALGPCSFAYMAPLLAIAFKMGSEQMLYPACLLLAYGIGHCSIIVLAGSATGQLQKYMDWNQKSHGALLLKKICGVLLLIGGLFLLYTV